MIGRFGPDMIFYNTFVLASVATYGFLDLASVVAYEFLGIFLSENTVFIVFYFSWY